MEKKKKRREPEYKLNIFHHYDEQTKKATVVFLLQTIQEFVNFNYEILLEEEVDQKRIHLKILGLHAPSMLMPGTGPARSQRDFSNLDGTYVLSVTKWDGTANEFEIEVTPKHITLLHAPPNPFVLLSTQSVMLS